MEYFIDESVLYRFFGAHEVVAIAITLDLFDRLAGVLRRDPHHHVLHVLEVLGLDLDVAEALDGRGLAGLLERSVERAQPRELPLRELPRVENVRELRLGVGLPAVVLATLEVRVVEVANGFFGGNIAVAGLLCAGDVRRELEADGDDATFLIPSSCLTNGRFLDGPALEELCADLVDRTIQTVERIYQIGRAHV